MIETPERAETDKGEKTTATPVDLNPADIALTTEAHVVSMDQPYEPEVEENGGR